MTDRLAKTRQLQQKDRMNRFEQLMLYQHQSIMPNLAAKSFLFKPTMKGRRPFFQEWQPVLTVNLPNTELFFRFNQLDQVDLTGWLILIQFAKQRQDLVAAFSGFEFLRRMRKQGNSRDYAWLEGFVDRMRSTSIRVRMTDDTTDGQRNYRYDGSLAPQAFVEETRGLYALQLSKVLWSFFGVDSWSHIDLEKRFALGQNQWALAFQAFLSANQSPCWSTWSDLHALWGQGYSEEAKFREMFRARVLKPLMEQGVLKQVTNKGRSIGLFW